MNFNELSKDPAGEPVKQWNNEKWEKFARFLKTYEFNIKLVHLGEQPFLTITSPKNKGAYIQLEIDPDRPLLYEEPLNKLADNEASRT
jgi:hypothetical protein